jgi:prephenate dehydrogenase
MSGRVAILGMGAIGHVIARALEGRAELVKVNRTNAPLHARASRRSMRRS